MSVYISAYLAIDRRMIEKSSVIAMSNDAGPYGWNKEAH